MFAHWVWVCGLSLWSWLVFDTNVCCCWDGDVFVCFLVVLLVSLFCFDLFVLLVFGLGFGLYGAFCLFCWWLFGLLVLLFDTPVGGYLFYSFVIWVFVLLFWF